MKKLNDPVLIKGMITLEVDPNDSVTWKLAMLLEAAFTPDSTIEQISKKYGYTREYFYQVFDKFKTLGSQGLQDKPTGPKKNSKRTPEVTKQVVRHRYMDPEASSEVIAQKMTQAGFPISQRSVQRVIQEYGLQKGGPISQILQKSKKA
jgi:hypothetical protein